jgi:DNA polymerase-3 subunit beta
MHVVVDRAAVLRELNLVARAAETRATIPSLSHVLLEARDDGALRLTTNNLEYGLASGVEALVIEPGVICLPARSFLQLVSALEGQITICTDANHYATIIAGRSRSRMPGEEADTSSELAPMPEGAVAVPSELFVRLLTCVGFAAAKVSGQFEVPAALVRFTGEVLVCAATDSHRFALAHAATAAAAPCEFLFPSAAMACVKKLVEGQERAYVAATSHHLFVSAGSRLLAARKLAGSFPDYDRILSEPSAPPMEIDSASLSSAMIRVLLFTEASTCVSPRMRFLLRRGELVISAASVHVGEGEGSLACDYSGPEIAVSFNPRYILDFLGFVPNGRVRAWIKDDHTPAEWRLADDDTYRYVVGPQCD